MQVEPYLNFHGRAEEAVEFYRTALGAQGIELMRFKDAPDPVPAGMLPPGFENKIMHGIFQVGESKIMVSDGAHEPSAGHHGFSLALNVATPAEADRFFAALSDGGQVAMALGKTFWSPRFGVVVDRFGINWMVNTMPS